MEDESNIDGRFVKHESRLWVVGRLQKLLEQEVNWAHVANVSEFLIVEVNLSWLYLGVDITKVLKK